MSQVSISGRVIGGQRAAIPSEPSNRQGDTQPYPPPVGARNPTTAPKRPPQQRKEGDLIVGPHNRSAIGTLVERQTRFVKLLRLPAHNSTELLHALVRTLNELPPPLRRTVKWDQGTEMARHLEITQATETKIYFCDSASPWQRGSNENTNGLLRQYFPKSTGLSVHSARHLAHVENELNRRPRITLGDRALADLFATLLASEHHPSLR